MELTILQEFIGIELPIIQAPMAGVQGSALAVAVCSAGGVGSLPCAMLGPDGMRKELAAIISHTRGPFNVIFFCQVAHLNRILSEKQPGGACSHHIIKSSRWIRRAPRPGRAARLSALK